MRQDEMRELEAGLCVYECHSQAQWGDMFSHTQGWGHLSPHPGPPVVSVTFGQWAKGFMLLAVGWEAGRILPKGLPCQSSPPLLNVMPTPSEY